MPSHPAERSFAQRLDELEGETVDIVELREYYDAVVLAREEAVRAVARYFVFWALSWALFYAVATGAISESTVASFKVINPRWILVAAPPLMGSLFYLIATATWSSAIRMSVMRRLRTKRWPSLAASGLINLMLTPSIINTEWFLAFDFKASRDRTISVIWVSCVTMAFFFASFYSLWQTIEFVWRLYPGSAEVTYISIAIGVLFWARGLSAAQALSKY